MKKLTKTKHSTGRRKTGKQMELLKTLLAGETFYTDVKPNNVKAYAGRAGKATVTENCIVIENYTDQQPLIKRLTKVTIL